MLHIHRGFDQVINNHLADFTVCYSHDFPLCWFDLLEVHNYGNQLRRLKLAINCLILASVACTVVKLFATCECELTDCIFAIFEVLYKNFIVLCAMR